jgi:hypothetical protein
MPAPSALASTGGLSRQRSQFRVRDSVAAKYERSADSMRPQLYPFTVNDDWPATSKNLTIPTDDRENRDCDLKFWLVRDIQSLLRGCGSHILGGFALIFSTARAENYLDRLNGGEAGIRTPVTLLG